MINKDSIFLESLAGLTEEFANEILELFKHHKTVVILFYAEMGSGKTTFIRSLAKALGIDGLTSPSFIGLNEYEHQEFKIMHYDLYQHNIDNEYLIDRLATANSLVLLEWAEKLSSEDLFIFGASARLIKIEIRVNHDDSRSFVFC
jgi:tRNA threonylcarbamoyladenosine biosynthesis protein TsaE